MTGTGDRTRLVIPRDAPPASLMPRQDTDATTALCRGLAEYLEQLELDWPGAGRLRFALATHTWADYEQADNTYPRAFVGTIDAEGIYDGGLGQDDQIGDVLGGAPLAASGGWIADSFEELVVPVTVELHCAHPEQRRGVCAMVEQGCRPYRGRSGFTLELPHYFNARSHHTAMKLSYQDNEEDAARNYRKARVVIQSRVPVIVLHAARPVRAIHHSSQVTEQHVATTDPPPIVRVGSL